MPQTASSGRGRGEHVDLVVVVTDLDALAMVYLDAVFPAAADEGQGLIRQDWATYIPGVPYRAPC
jgi:hypothetical protein